VQYLYRWLEHLIVYMRLCVCVCGVCVCMYGVCVCVCLCNIYIKSSEISEFWIHCQKRLTEPGHTCVFIVKSYTKYIKPRWPERVVQRLTASCEMAIAFSKRIHYTERGIWFFLFQVPVPSLFPTTTQALLMSSASCSGQEMRKKK